MKTIDNEALARVAGWVDANMWMCTADDWAAILTPGTLIIPPEIHTRQADAYADAFRARVREALALQVAA